MPKAPRLASTEWLDLSKQVEALCDKHAILASLNAVTSKDPGTTPEKTPQQTVANLESLGTNIGSMDPSA